MAVAAPRRCGWVGWSGVLEPYPLALRRGAGGAAAGDNGDGGDGGDGDGGDAAIPVLTLSVAAGSACGPLGHLHAGSVWNGAVRLAQLLEAGRASPGEPAKGVPFLRSS